MDFKCPHCGQTLEVDDAAALEHGNCPACGKDLVIPEPPSPEVPPAPHTPEIHLGSPWVSTQPKHPVGRKITIVAILVVVISSIAFAIGHSTSRKSTSLVYLINGTNQVQTVQINRSRHRLEAGGKAKLEIRTPWYYFRKTHRIRYVVGGKSTNTHGLKGVLIVNLANTTLVRAGILSEDERNLWPNYQGAGLWIVKREWSEGFRAFDIDQNPFVPDKPGSSPLLLEPLRVSGPVRAAPANLLDDVVPKPGAAPKPKAPVKIKGRWIILGTYTDTPATLAEWKRKMRDGVVSGGLLGNHQRSVDFWVKQSMEWAASFPPGRKPGTLETTNRIAEIGNHPELTIEDKYKQLWQALGGDPTTPGFELPPVEDSKKEDEGEES